MLNFIKLHGLGNDFILFDRTYEGTLNYHKLAKNVCDRHFGIGADGILIVENSEVADIKMRIFNSDGSEATMCGNGIRCFAKYVYDNRKVKETKFSVETLSGVLNVDVFEENNKVKRVKVDMGKPLYKSKLIPYSERHDDFLNQSIEIEGIQYFISTIIMGCVHTVLFCEDIDKIDIDRIGPLIENHSIFPTKTNVNFCRIIDSKNIEVRTWEIGAGQTLACGTGATSAAIISSRLCDSDNKINVHLRGGTVKIEICQDTVFMTGPAKLICNGLYNWE